MNDQVMKLRKSAALTDENKDRIRTWLKALRSGSYEQGQNVLRSRVSEGLGVGEDKYCCLGVACSVFAQELDLDVSVAEEDSWGCYYSYGEASTVLPENLANYLGFQSCDPAVYVRSGREIVGITRANDLLGLSFDELADAVEYTYLAEL